MSLEFINNAILTQIALQYQVKLSIEVDGNSKKPRAYLKLFKNFGDGKGSRSKKVEIEIDRIGMLTNKEVLMHVSQFINPYIGF